MRNLIHGPLSAVIKGKSMPRWFIDQTGQRFEFHSIAKQNPDGSFDLDQLTSKQCLLSPGVIYQRKKIKRPSLNGFIVKNIECQIVNQYSKNYIVTVDLGYEEMVDGYRTNATRELHVTRAQFLEIEEELDVMQLSLDAALADFMRSKNETN